MDLREEIQQRRDEAERDSRFLGPEEQTEGGNRDTVNEWGRIEASGKVQAFDEVLELLDQVA